MRLSTVAGALLALTDMAPARAATPPVDSAQQDIVITGTRIRQGADATLASATNLSAEELERATPTGIPDALNKLPQFQLSSSPSRSTHNFANSASNGNTLNLRGVGGIRTLILLDGVRVASTTYRGTVDVDVLPGLLVERIDILTTGASATYGSDAVAGAVNFVLNPGFSGIKALAQTGISARGDNGHSRLGLAFGTSFLGNRAHLMLSAEASDSAGMNRGERSAGRRGLVFAGETGIGLPGSATNPLVIRADARLTTASEYGKIIGPSGNPFVDMRFAADGSLAPFNPGTPTGTPGFAIGGDGFIIPAEISAISATEARKAFGRLTFDVSPDFRLFAQLGLTRLEQRYTSLANSFLQPTPAMLFSGNPYLPREVQNAFASPADAITLVRYGGEDPQPQTVERTRLVAGSLGAEGDLGGVARWKAALSRSRSQHDVAQTNIWDWQRSYAAIDAVRGADGQIVCRAALDPDAAIRARFAACQPLNLLVSGATFTAQPGYRYALGTSRYRATITQTAALVQVNSAPLRFRDRPVDMAFGAEYRRQTLDLTSNADPARLESQPDRDGYFAGLRGVSPAAQFYWLTNVGSAQGTVTVGEMFGEVALPLSGTLNASAAARLTHYSTSGSEATWKAAVQWQPAPALQLRAGLSHDSRAPSLFELYAGSQSGIGLLVDPVSGQTGNVLSISGGNPGLEPERSDSVTLGATIEPGWATGLRFSVDYYRLRISDEIGTLSITQVAQNCFSSNSATAECALITQPDPKRLPTSIRTVPVNVAFLETAGFDVETSWRGRLGRGNLVVQLLANVLTRFQTQQGRGAPTLEFAGFGQTANQPIGRPRLRATFNLDYRLGDFSLTVAQQYLGRLKVGSQEPNQNYNGLNIGPVGYTDLSLRRRLPAGGGEAELFLTINNLFDRKPPIVPGATPGLNFPTIISLYDIVGRAVTAGVRLQL